MDAVAGLLDGPRARGAFLLRSTMDPPWSLRIEDEAPLTLVAVVRGEAWIVPDGARAGRGWRRRRRHRPRPGALHGGRRPGHRAAGRDPPGQRCTTPDGQEVAQMMDLGVRTWGNAADGATVMLTGTYQLDGEVSRRLLRALPTLLVAARRRLGQPARRADGRRDRQGRPGPGGRARPPARPAADRRAARLVRAPRGRRARRGTAPTAIRSSGARCACCTTTRRTRGRWRGWPTRRRVARRAGPPLQRARRRAADDASSPAGGSRSRPTCCASPAPPSARWPTRSATAARSRSAPRSSASAASARASTARARSPPDSVAQDRCAAADFPGTCDPLSPRLAGRAVAGPAACTRARCASFRCWPARVAVIAGMLLMADRARRAGRPGPPGAGADGARAQRDRSASTSSRGAAWPPGASPGRTLSTGLEAYKRRRRPACASCAGSACRATTSRRSSATSAPPTGSASTRSPSRAANPRRRPADGDARSSAPP